MESTSPTRARDADARWTPTRDDANDANDGGDALARTHDDGYDVKVAEDVGANKFSRASSFEWWWSWIRFASDA